MTRARRWLIAPAIAALLALVAAACTGGEDELTLETEFTDVADLVAQAPVFTADVRVGTVTAIELTDNNTARVTMTVRPDTGLPSEVRAVLKQTSLLGERMVELVPTGDSGELSSGFIPDSDVQSDLEDLVTSGNELLAFVAADRVNAMVHAGAVTFGGRGGTVGQLVTDLEGFVGDFEEGKDEITDLLDSLDALLTTLASEAETNAGALEALARSNRALMEEDDRLLDALEDLRELGAVGERILRENRTELNEFLGQLQTILDAVTRIDGALQGVLTQLPRHNLHVPNANKNEFVQIWLDLVGCDTESEQRDNPAKSCQPPNPGDPGTQAPGDTVDQCDEDAEGCRYGHDTHNEPNDFGDGDPSDDQDEGAGDGSGQ